MRNKLVLGVGVNDVISSTRKTLAYKTWTSILCRCYSNVTRIRFPTYIECTMCDEWKSLNAFKQWFDENYIEGFHLDKDILVEGNKVYSPDTCRFVPQYLNKLLTDRRIWRGDLPLGVSLTTTIVKNIEYSYVRASCSNGYGKQLSKTFKTIGEAQSWYSTTKARIVKEQATRAFLENAIKTDVYLALVRRNF